MDFLFFVFLFMKSLNNIGLEKCWIEGSILVMREQLNFPQQSPLSPVPNKINT